MDAKGLVADAGLDFVQEGYFTGGALLVGGIDVGYDVEVLDLGVGL